MAYPLTKRLKMTSSPTPEGLAALSKFYAKLLFNYLSCGLLLLYSLLQVGCVENCPFALELHPVLTLTSQKKDEMTQAVNLAVSEKDTTARSYKIQWTHYGM